MKHEKSFSRRIVLVDDEVRILLSFSVMLKSAGYRDVITVDDSRNVLACLGENSDVLVVMDLIMPFINGRELLTLIKDRYPQLPVIVMTAANEIDSAVECMKAGAMDYLVKPVEKNRFLSAIEKAFELCRLEEEVSSLKESLLSESLAHPGAFAPVVTCNRSMMAIFKYIEAISCSPQPVLITGETGVGKELLARSLFKCLGEKGNFVAVNIAGLDDAMFSDTLFGHKKGAFTGADAHREGLISRAAGGMLFLDEIGDLENPSQIKLLRLIQEREYYPLGVDIPQKTDTRLIVSTNRDLQDAMEKGAFRKDLYYRLNSHHIHIPPLRERKDDIPLLVNYFLQTAATALKKKRPTVPPELFNWLKLHSFPGNIRELESMIYDAVSRHSGGVLSLNSFKEYQADGRSSAKNTAALRSGAQAGEVLPDNADIAASIMVRLEKICNGFPTLKKMENFLMEQAMKRSCGNQGVAASFLGISRQALNKRLSRSKDES